MKYEEVLQILKTNLRKISQVSILGGILLALILYFVYPITYQSEVKILPPEDQSVSNFANFLGGAEIQSFVGLGSFSGNSQLFAEILKSRTASEYVVKKCGLINYYDADVLLEAITALQKDIEIEVTKEGIILLAVPVSTSFFSRFSDQNEQIKYLSAAVSNTFVAALDSINKNKLNQRAKRTRIFIESQIDNAKKSLNQSEESLKEFQLLNKTLSVPEQLQASLDNAARIKSQLIIAEIELQTLRYDLKEESDYLRSLKKKIQVLQNQYNQIEAGRKLDRDYLPSFNEIPELSLELARLTREVKVQNEVYLLLQRQYYTEKIQENKNITTVEILDEAVPPLKAKSPRLLFHTALGTVFITLTYILYLIASTSLRKKNE